jgi:hypothetical protein
VDAPAHRFELVRRGSLARSDRLASAELVLVGRGRAGFCEPPAELLRARVWLGLRRGLDLEPRLPPAANRKSCESAHGGAEEERCLSFHIRHSSTTPVPKATRLR